MPASTRHRMIRQIRDSLVHLKQIGCTGFDCAPEHLDLLARLTAAPAGPAAATGGTESLSDIRSHLGACTRCPLHRGRTHIVFGEGDPKARLVFVGEGPGEMEDRTGRPFVGAAGELLTKIIEAMQLSREQVYIGNIVKCRPPGNRNPAPDEIGKCLPFIQRQIAAIGPKVICTLGKVAAQTLLETSVSVTRLRGTFHTFMDIPLMPTFHPAYLLRNPQKKRDVWNDVQQIMKLLE